MLRNTVFFIFIQIFVCSCSSNSLKVDISSVKEEANVIRFDQLFFQEKYSDSQKIIKLDSLYNNFASVYFDQIINIGLPSSSNFTSNLAFFRNEKTIIEAKHSVDSTFFDFSELENKLIIGLKHYKYYFPETKTPDVYTYVSGFNEAIVIGRNFIGVSLDKYLGSQCKYYPLLGIHQYKLQGMIPEKIPFDALMGWIMNEFPKESGSSTLIDAMIYHGKMMYLLEACFPEASDEIKIGYTIEQLNFCTETEAAMWTYLIDQKLLFKTNRMLLKKFIYPSPYTTPFTSESPGRTGIWIGWQIVRSYMKNNPNTTIQELVIKSERSILNEAKYFPE